jgi:hypothetical protein
VSREVHVGSASAEGATPLDDSPSFGLVALLICK